MPLDALSPIVQELTRNPVAFLGGFFAGALRLNLNEDPVKTWLNQQGMSPTDFPESGTSATSGSKTSGPQSISIE